MTKQSIHKIPVLAGTLKSVDAHTKQYGLVEALRLFAQRLNVKLECDLPADTRNILAKERVVLIGNHPTDTEPFALFACLPPRQNVKLIVSDCMSNLSKAIDDHLIPVHVRIEEIYSPVGWRPTAFLAYATSDTRTWTSEEAHEFNVAQMEKASHCLAQGDLIMIFPGRRAKDGRWFPGVGHLVKDAKTAKPIYTVFSRVTGTSHWDFIRLIPFLRWLMPPIQVRFGPPLLMKDIRDRSGKEIAWDLERQYSEWEKSLPQ